MVGFFGALKILQCDNGQEFKGVLLILLKKYGIKVINDRPRTPSTQGLVEQENGTAKTIIRSQKTDLGSTAWASMLADIALKMNKTYHSTTKKRLMK